MKTQMSSGNVTGTVQYFAAASLEQYRRDYLLSVPRT
jgi:hypothetical protein